MNGYYCYSPLSFEIHSQFYMRNRKQKKNTNLSTFQDQEENDEGGNMKAITRDWDDRENVPFEFSCFIPYNLVSQHSIPGNFQIN